MAYLNLSLNRGTTAVTAGIEIPDNKADAITTLITELISEQMRTGTEGTTQ